MPFSQQVQAAASTTLTNGFFLSWYFMLSAFARSALLNQQRSGQNLIRLRILPPGAFPPGGEV